MQLAAIRQILDWVKEGREIIPLTGAGISIESGIPPMAELTRYLAKVQAYIRFRVFRDRPAVAEDNDPPLWPTYLYTYLAELGWPDPGQLDTDLWHWLKKEGCASLQLPTEIPHLWMDLLVENEILHNLESLDSKLVGWLKRLSGRSDDRESIATAEPPGDVGYRLLHLRGSYWKGLLSSLTRSDPDLIDALFQRLVRRRRPGSSHRFLALLAPQLRIQLVLTLNFDQLLEAALKLEGIRPAVYGVAGGAPLPYPALIQEDLSIVKLHGSAFGLMVGDQLDRPVDRETRARFRDYLPHQPVLLVLGVSGWDQRVIDLLELVEEKEGDILWLHFEPDGPAAPVRWLAQKWRQDRRPSELKWLRVQSPGAFLKELYRHRSLSHPSCGRPLLTDDPRPIAERPTPKQPDAAESSPPIVVFEDEGESIGLGASRALSDLAAAGAERYRTIWIDMEAMYTEDDLVVEIFSRLRQFDPFLPPEILPAERSSGSRKIRRRLFAALGRGRYLIAFNAVGSFGRAPTQHHRREKVAEDEHFDKGIQLVTHLIEDVDREPWLLKDSILAFAVDKPRCRTEEETRRHLERMQPLLDLRSRISGSPLIRWHEVTAAVGPDPGMIDPGSDDGKGLFLLSAFRRRRSYIAMRRLLPEILGIQRGREGTAVDDQLADWERRGLILRAEGGEYWMSRGFRNAIYTRDEEPIRGSGLVDVGTAADLEARLERFLRSIQVHHWIAGYYEERFSSSRETFALIELIYHRVSALRYATRLSRCWSDCGALPSERLPAVAPVWTRLFGKEPPSLEGIDALRLTMTRALCGLFHRQRERLLRTVPGPALVGMVNWIGSHELDNFRRATCLWKPAGQVPSDRGEVAPVSEIEPVIEDEVGRLGRTLDDIACEVHLDRLEIEKLIDLRFGRPSQPPEVVAAPATEVGRRLEGVIETLRGRFSRGALDEGDCRRFEALFEVAAQSRFLCPEIGQEIADLIDLGSPTVLKAAGSGPSGVHAVEAGVARLRADLYLSGVSPWDAKGWPLAGYLKTRERAQNANDQCDLALRALEAMPSDGEQKWLHDSPVPLVSYLHSLKGRAHYLQGDFVNAFAMLDRSRGGLAENLEANRSALAVSLLRLAECLMVRADYKIIAWCQEATGTSESGVGRNGGIEDLSEEGQRKLAGADATSAVVDTLLGQCISNWSERLLQSLTFSPRPSVDSWQGVLRGAWRGLGTAHELLDQVERVLEYARRNLEWWACLYQLRAQIEIERLLLTVTGHPTFERGNHSEERRYIARFREALRSGLRSVRRGLDLLLPREGMRTEEGLRGNRMVCRFLRQWVELMVCGAYLSLFVRQQGIRQIGDELWEQWIFLNQREGIVKLPSAEPVESWFKSAHKKLQSTWSPSLQTRGRVLAAISDCMRTAGDERPGGSALNALIAATCEPEDEGTLIPGPP